MSDADSYSSLHVHGLTDADYPFNMVFFAGPKIVHVIYIDGPGVLDVPKMTGITDVQIVRTQK